MKLLLFFFIFFININYSINTPINSGINLVAVDLSARTQIAFSNITIKDGSGNIYVNIEPKIGLNTQDSFKIATTYAFRQSNIDINKYDIIFEIEDLFVSYVDGPSGGLAIGLQIYAMLNDLKIPNDILITGELLSNGNVKSVGSIYEKAYGAMQIEKNKFIVPKENIYEIIPTIMKLNEYNFKIIQVENFDEAKKAIFYEIYPEFKLENTKINENLNEILIDEEISFFENISRKNIKKANQLIENIFKEDLLGYKDFFKNEIKINEKLIDMGYLYTGANNLFLLSINLNVPTDIENAIEKEKQQVLDCFDSLDFNLEINTNNFEIIAGARVRERWAKERYNEIFDFYPLMHTEKIEVLNSLNYANSWCDLANDLLDNAKIQGEQINKEKMRIIAKNRIEKTKQEINIEALNPLILRNYNNALYFYEKEHYFESIFEIIYFQTMFLEKTDAFNIDIDTYSNLTSFWAKIYYPQAIYLKEEGNLNSAKAIHFLSTYLEEEYRKIMSDEPMEPIIIIDDNIKATIKAYLPAVDSGAKSYLSYAEIKINEGSGNILINTNPRIGTDTQNSFITASKFAFLKSGYDINKHELRFEIKDIQSTVISGASAGLSVAMSIYSSLIGEKIPDNFLMTGTISENGNVNRVGGIYEKVKIGLENNKDTFIIPKENIYELLALKFLLQEENFTIIQVENFDEAKKAIFYGIYPEFKLENTKINEDLIEFKSNEEMIGMFNEIAYGNFKKYNEIIDNIISYPKIKEYGDFLRQEAKVQKTLIDMGYSYTGANNLFNLITNAYMTTDTDLAILKEKENLEKCLRQIPDKFELNSNNIELIAGAFVRKNWAINELNSYPDEIPNIQRQKEALLQRLINANSWCEFSSNLFLSSREIKGEIFYEESIRKMAQIKIKELEDQILFSEILNRNVFEHLKNAKQFFSQGKYSAAIYECIYASSMYGNIPYLYSSYDATFFKFQSLNSFWAKIFYPHAHYLQKNNDIINSNRIFYMAYEMEYTYNKIKQENSQHINEMKYGSFSRFMKNDFFNTFEGQMLKNTFQMIILLALIFFFYNFLKDEY